MDKDETQDIDLENNDEELDLDLGDDAFNVEKDWKAEALKYKSMATRYKSKLGDKKPQEAQPVEKNNISDREPLKATDILDSDEFSLYREGYTNDEIKLIMRNGGRQALKDDKSPLVLGLKVAREQRKAEDASSNTSDTAGQSEVERKYTIEQMKNMKADELANLIGFADPK